MHTIDTLRPTEVFPAWPRAQREVAFYALQAPPSPYVLRTAGFLTPDQAEQVTEWFLAPSAITEDVHRAYAALARESLRLFAVARDCLGVQVVFDDAELGAAELCSDVREHRLLTLTVEDPHPLLTGDEFTALRVVHDVFGHAALGLGFDLQSEYATWLQCRTLFSPAARAAAFCELVGAVTAYITTGDKSGLRAKLPPAALRL